MNTIQDYEYKLEELETAYRSELRLQSAGLVYSESRMREISKSIEMLAKEALGNFSIKEIPRPLFISTLFRSHASKYNKLDNEIFRLRNEAVQTKAAGEVVNLSNIRLFNYKHLREGEIRKHVLDELIDRAHVLTPILQKRFLLSREILRPHSLTPLDIMLEEEKIGLVEMTSVIEQIAGAVKDKFRIGLHEFSQEIIGRDAEYYDDYYVFGNAVFDPVDSKLSKLNLQKVMRNVARNLGFNLSNIHIDDKVRLGKLSSPECIAVRVPSEIHVLYQKSSPVYDYTGYFHEMGHAVHLASINPALKYTQKYLIPDGISEIFSFLFEILATEPLFLMEDVGLPKAVVNELVRRRLFLELYYIIFYAANSIFKVQFWRENMTMKQADNLYGQLYKRFLGLDMPGHYWQIHHILGQYDMYAPSYLLASIRMGELREFLRSKYTERWWHDRRAGEFLANKLMSPGRNIPLETFSKLDPRPYLGFLGL